MMLPKLMQDERIKPYIIDDGEREIGVHNSVIELLATIPMYRDFDLDPDEFFKKLKPIEDK